MTDDLDFPLDSGFLYDDGRASLAIAAGLVAAIAGGLVWAAIAIFGDLEIGWAAWAIGAAVGAAMGRVTSARHSRLGMTAAGLAALAILLGKAFIFLGSTGAVAREIATTPEYLAGAVAWQMYDARELQPITLDSLDAWRAGGDTLSDALWAQMTGEAGARLSAMSEEEKLAAARVTAESALQEIGLASGVASQFSAFDLLWFGLAIATAYRLLARQPAVRPVPVETVETEEEDGQPPLA